MHGMIGVKTAAWLALGAIHLAVVVRAILLEGREPYARAAWLLLLVALPGIGSVLYLLFGEPWISSRFRQRSRDTYEALLPFAPPAASPDQGRAAENPFRTCEAVSRWTVSVGNMARSRPTPIRQSP